MEPDDERGGYACICTGCELEIAFATYAWIRTAEKETRDPGGVRRVHQACGGEVTAAPRISRDRMSDEPFGFS